MKPTPASSPSPRKAPWVVAGGVLTAAIAALAVGCWFALPVFAPGWVGRHSPWAQPVVRMFLHGAGESPDQERFKPALEWVSADPDRRCGQLVPYLSAPDLRTRRAIAELIMLLDWRRPKSIDAALLPLLKEGDLELTIIVCGALIDVASIPTLEAHGIDPDPNAADAIAEAIKRLRAVRDSHAP